MKFIEMIIGIIEKLFKRTEGKPSDSPIEEGEEQVDVPVVKEENIEPKLTVSDEEPTGGEDRDVWVKVKDGGE